jgi:PII-like signaling protein
MDIKKNATLLRIFIGERDKTGHVPVYETIVMEALGMGLAGATVFKGIMGFGNSSRVHSSKILRLSQDLPIIIEIVDNEEKIKGFLPVLDKLLEESNAGALVTIEKAEIIKYIHSKQD